ncbi:hypothetical protein ACJIZ3_011144 [Penstemon smallii]|uniref:RING-type E3 ubiquitin transferase n=1 Tax=Penstemon smallii TaxID=265156 RepID=A0ABD3ULX7_9LAMI
MEEEWQQQVYWKTLKLSELPISTSSNGSARSFYSGPQINLYFSYRTLTHHWLSNQVSVQFVGEQPGPLLVNYFHVNHKEALCSANTRENIQRTLNNWPLSNRWLSLLIEDVSQKTRDMVNSVSSGCNVLNVAVEVIHKHVHVVFANDQEVDLVMQRSMEESSSVMVPATDASIESLERKTMDCANESCSICLEEFFNGGEAACMPCSHMFHRDCIAEWLRTSHYCPLCRFEMPTA